MIKNIQLIELHINNNSHINCKYNVFNSTLIKNKFYLKIEDILLAYIPFLENNYYFKKNDIDIFLDILNLISEHYDFNAEENAILPVEWSYEERIDFLKECHVLNGDEDDVEQQILMGEDFSQTINHYISIFLKHKFSHYFEFEQLSNKVNKF